VQQAAQKLKQKSKDLAIAAWLTEGLVQLHGFAGFRDGLLLIQGLCERYWDTVYPLPDEGDLEVRAAPLQSLLERNSPLWLGEIALTKSPIKAPDTDDQIPVTYNLWHSIVVAQLEDKKPLQGPMEDAATSSPTDFLQNLHGDMEAAEAALTALNDLLNEKFESAAPSTVAAAEMIAKCKSRVATVLLKRGVRLGDSGDESAAEGSSNGDGAPGNAYSSNGARTGPIGTREDALQRLREVADFFRRTEPHSPVPYLIQRAINWSRMSFEQLLLELVKDENARLQINSTLGLDESGASSYSGYESSSETTDESTYQ
jgi:type VI secretion system protein ImpA